jgi:hypothetical protein
MIGCGDVTVSNGEFEYRQRDGVFQWRDATEEDAAWKSERYRGSCQINRDEIVKGDQPVEWSVVHTEHW